MKFWFLAATLSCTGAMAAFSLETQAETLPQSQVNNDSSGYIAISIQPELSLEQNSHLSHNLQEQPVRSSYSVYSFAKDKQITLSNIQQPIVLEDIEWYIEKF